MKPIRNVVVAASAGGHWVQLLRLRPAWTNHRATYISTNKNYLSDLQNDITRSTGVAFRAVVDANRKDPLRIAVQFVQMIFVMARARPDVVISTGASVGYMALRIGKLFGARTVWIDSIANAEEVSMSGRLVRPYADLWLTQWERLAEPGGPDYRGAVF